MKYRLRRLPPGNRRSEDSRSIGLDITMDCQPMLKPPGSFVFTVILIPLPGLIARKPYWAEPPGEGADRQNLKPPSPTPPPLS
jgi:hypothetical protein